MGALDADLFTGSLAALVEGALAFRKNEYRSGRNLMPRLAAGQRPGVLMIGCSDSRVDPALICGAGPGEVFTVRNVANLVPPCDAGGGRGDSVRAALEYGVGTLGVSHIVVFGHAHCGGVRAMRAHSCRSNPPERPGTNPLHPCAETWSCPIQWTVKGLGVGGHVRSRPRRDARPVKRPGPPSRSATHVPPPSSYPPCGGG